MLQHTNRMTLMRKRSAHHKVFVPSNARENQYLLAEFKPNNALLQLITGEYQSGVSVGDFYRKLSHHFFKLCGQHGFDNVSLIGKHKLVRVMYSEEQQVLETEQQILFMYSPIQHVGLTTFFDEQQLSDKIQLLFLATGDDLRHHAPKFHNRVARLLTEFSRMLSVSVGSFKIRDHQHLTFDVFAKAKGERKIKTHGFRPVAERYKAQSFLLPKEKQSMTFAVVNLPIHRGLLEFCDIDETAPDPYNPLYMFVSNQFIKVAKQYNLNNLAIIANGKTPIIRCDNEDYVLPKGELIYLGYKPASNDGMFTSQWDSRNLVDSIKLVFVASDNDCHKTGYGRFVNHISQAVKKLCVELNYQAEHDAVMLRFHQHLMYTLSKAL
ncbi:DUF3083 family protein [Thalassotalea maritima]|uniref:DUF3083 family protein n=1 Tax=Thalassotalea maritima TaxID=3242416 RepID=UPI0035270156